MDILAKFIIAIAFALLCVQLTTCVPIAEKESEDKCKLKELETIPACENDDKECGSSNVQKREKRQNLCSQYPDCSYCGPTIQEPLVVEPEIVQPVFIDNDLPVDIEQEIEVEVPSEEVSPPKMIERNIVIENDNETQYYRGYVESAANITTIIRLTNLINNTNIVNMPTTLNNTNINNIHVYQNKAQSQGEFGLRSTESGPCCYVVGRKKCKQSTTGKKCNHKRQKVCGHQCTHKLIHPNKNPCTSTPQWPYVSCPPGQYPGYYPLPNYPGFYPQPVPPQFEGFDEDDDDDFPMFPEDEELENPVNGWIVGPEKCKVVSEDGLQIFNCTNKGYEFEHPYARNTVSESKRRDPRHAGVPMQNQMPPPMAYYPVVYQPVYLQPVYMPQYYQQPPMNYYQPQQIPFPPMADPESYFEDEHDSNEVSSRHKPGKNRKHRPVVMEVDDEL